LKLKVLLLLAYTNYHCASVDIHLSQRFPLATPLFDDLLDGALSLEVHLEGNGNTLCSLRIRISSTLKWLADSTVFWGLA